MNLLGKIVYFANTGHTGQNYLLTNAMLDAVSRAYYGEVMRTHEGSPFVAVRIVTHPPYKVSTWHTSDLIIVDISRDEAIEIQRGLEQKYSEKYKASSVSYMPDIKKLMVVPQIPFEEMNYSKPPEVPLFSNTYLFPYVQVGNKSFPERIKQISDCCKIFSENRSCQDIMVLIPQDWVNFMGYTESIIIQWLSFIKDIGFSFAPVYEGKASRPDHAPFNPLPPSYAFLKTNAYYQIRIPASEYPALNYLNFLLVRYLFLAKYNNIPGLCLQLAYNTSLSNWTILMLVHSARYYSDLYGLVSTSHPVDIRLVKIPNFTSGQNEPKLYFKRLIKLNSVNNAFDYVLANESIQASLQSLLENKKWNEIEDWINQLKDLPIIARVPPPIKTNQEIGREPRPEARFRIADPIVWDRREVQEVRVGLAFDPLPEPEEEEEIEMPEDIPDEEALNELPL